MAPKRKKKWLLSGDSVLVQTPPLQVDPKYTPAFCVVDEDAGLGTNVNPPERMQN
jgi:hypothetical protein